MVTVRKKTDYEGVSQLLSGLLEAVPYEITNLANMTSLFSEYIAGINWVGFYLVRDEKLILGPYQGRIGCTEVEFGSGVTGTAAEKDEIVIVDNALKIAGHVPADMATRAVIAVPVHKDGKIYGVLEVDSPFEQRFTIADHDGLQHCIEIFEELLPKMI